MGKKRIFEIAKEYGVKSPEIIELLAKHNITKTNFSSVEESDVAIIHAAFSKKAVKQEQPQAVHKTEKPQASGSAEKAKPAATSSPAKPRPEKTERPSMIVKPIIMTVETNAEGKSTITHNALQRDKAVKPVSTENKPENRAAVPQNQTVNNDGKNKYRNAPNHINADNKGPKTEKGFGSAATPAKAAEKPAGAGQVTGERNLNANLNRGPQNRPTSSQGNVNRPNPNRDFNRQGQNQGQGFNRQGQNFNRGDRQGQGQGQGFNRQGQNFNRGDRQGQGQGQGFNRQGQNSNR
ncbi:MAG: translation initiation factor IF-2 N-terminal domain-containing protein, partial [Acidaminococcaceae bacterium]|nr:translation initiation factor IF-2 N-terminal domain-containing protein [Acidaminococcaceae bacterium]